MHKSITHIFMAVAAATALSALGVAGAGASRAAAQAPQQVRAPSAGTPHLLAVPGAALWLARYNGPANAGDGASSVAVSPGGQTVFVTGYSRGVTSGTDYATVAYSAVTGTRLWAARYNGPANLGDTAKSVAVSPDGTKVFVTGQSNGGSTTRTDYATVAYRASDGKRLWAVRYNSTLHGYDGAASVAVNPGGGKVFVTGAGYGVATGDGGVIGEDYVTVAYSASTGARLWVSRYNGPGNGRDFARSVMSPGNGKVYVTGASTGAGTDISYQYATVAYSASTGARLWVKRSQGVLDMATSLAVSPDRSTVFVTGSRWGGTGTADDYYTVAYNATTGAQRWAKRYNGPASSGDTATSVAAAGDGTKVFVTGYSYGGTTTRYDYATVAYNAATGAQVWAKRYSSGDGRFDYAESVASGNGKVYVTGASDAASGTNPDYATVAYSASTGASQWLERYNGPGDSTDEATSLAVSPGGARVFVTGASDAAYQANPDYATLAYSG